MRNVFTENQNVSWYVCEASSGKVHVPNFGGCQDRRTGAGVTTVSNSLILGGWVTKVLKNGDKT